MHLVGFIVRTYRDARSSFNTLWTGDADLRLYITTVQDGWRKSAFLTRAWFPRTTHLITQTWSISPNGPADGRLYEGWNFNSGIYLFTTDTK